MEREVVEREGSSAASSTSASIGHRGGDHGGIKVIRAALKLVLMMVIVGSLVIWIIMPTKTYKKNWQPKLRAKLNNSTYFGTQGANLMVFTFPVLFFAVVSSLYLHLGKKLKRDEGDHKKKDLLASWRGPLITKGPLGIVSGIEISFFVMFITLLVWSLSIYLYNSYANITPEENGEKVWQMKVESAGLRLGLVGNIGLALLFFPVTRGSSVLPIFGLTSEGSIKYHIWVGHIVMALFTAHGLAYIVYWISINDISQMVEWNKTGVSNVAGEVSLAAGLVLWVTTLPCIRRNMFELFFYTHYLYIVFVVFFVLHVGISYTLIMLPGFYLFMVDRFLRFLQSRQCVRLHSAHILPCQTLQLNFSKTQGLRYSPTSIMFINVPSISKLQWHPFTVTSNSSLETDTLSAIIKKEGSWTSKLHQILSSPSSVDRLHVSIEGPYGPVSTHFLRHDTLVMVCGGSGIAPFISIIKELMFMSTTTEPTKIPKVILICAFKYSPELAMLDLLQPVSGVVSNLDIRIEAYLTRDKEPSNSEPTTTIWFKPLPTDLPASPVLGQNAYLWLGAIISSSFAIFLILIGIITRLYIYPITDHKMFSSSVRATLNMLFMCVSVAITASAAVYWNKKQNAKELGQVQNIMTSPGSVERELESLPKQSFVQATNVHYGQRPDLKRMLVECEGKSVGVLVCGPKKMSHDVAAICSSGIASHLQFESISFSW